MSAFDSKKGPSKYGEHGGFNREGSRRQDDTVSKFAKDKRKYTPQQSDNSDQEKPLKTVRTVKTSVTKQLRGRRSFNPNFTEDNKFIGQPKQNRDYNNRDDNRGNRFNTERSERPNDNFNRSDRDGSNSHSDRPERERTGAKRYGFRSGDNNERRDSRDRRDGRDTRDNKDNRRKPFEGKPRNPKREYPSFDAPKLDKEVRLNKYIANSGVCSRREADELIEAGKITVNDVVITELGSRVMPGDVVKYNDRVMMGEKRVYILMNKPKGYVTTLEDPHADQTVMDLLKGACKERVYPVGRLDKNSVGVLLITNDGELAEQLTHPSFQKKKVYQATLDKALSRSDMEAIAAGVTLEDGFIKPDAVEYADENRRDIGIEIHSGRNRIVRRIFESQGYKVVKLDRVYFAGMTKKKLKRGAWRFLSAKEVATLKSGSYE